MPDVKFSNQYPYTDFHELNLDWVIKEVKYWSTKVGKTIQSINLTGTVGLVDTYTITYSDGSTSTFDVTNGNGISSVAKTGTAGLVDTYTINYSDGSTSTFEVTNGAAAVDPTLTLPDYAADAKVTGDKINRLDNLFDVPSPYVSQTSTHYISADGSLHYSTSWKCAYIKIDDETTIKQVVATTNTANFLAVAFYTGTPGTGTFISGVAFGSTGTVTLDNISIPNNAIYCLITNRGANYAAYTFSDYFNLHNFSDDMRKIDVMKSDKRLYDGGYVLKSDGVFYPANTFKSVKFNCENIEKLVEISGTSDSSSINIISFYSDLEGTVYLSGVAYSGISGETLNTIYDTPIPPTAKLCIVSSMSYNSISIIVRMKEGEPNLLDAFEDVKDCQLRYVFSRPIPKIDNDFTIVHDELWGGTVIDVDTGETRINVYKLDPQKIGMFLYRQIETDFNHLNTFSYNPKNDCLLFSNSSNDSGLIGNWFAIVKNPRGLSSSADLANNAIVYNVNVGYKVNAFWGNNNKGENDIVYLVSNGIDTVNKLMLSKTGGEFDGTYTILETYSTGVSGFIGGGCYWNEKLYIGNGTGLGYRILDLTTHEIVQVDTPYYDGQNLLNGSNQGIHIDADYIWQLVNKKNTDTVWLIQNRR